AVGVSVGGGAGAESTGLSGAGIGLGSDSGSTSSMSRAGISGIAGNVSVRSDDAEAGIARIFDADSVQRDIDAQVQIMQTFTREAPRAAATFAQNRITVLTEQLRNEPDEGKRAQLQTEIDRWGEGGLYRNVMHTAIGALGGGVPGAAGAAVAAGAAPLLNDMQASVAQALRESGLSPETARIAAQAVSGLTATAAGLVVGGPTGAALAAGVDFNNRQLHASETQWIRDNARRFAAQHGISEQQAEERLAQQAFRQVQFGTQGDWDAQAQSFLGQAPRQMLPPDAAFAEAGPGYMFHATPQQRANAQMYVSEVMRDPQAISFYRTNNIQQPTIAQIAQATGRDQQARERIAGQTIQAAVLAGALALAPAAGTVAAEVAAFARNPYGYCMVNPTKCLIAVDTAATTAAGVPNSTVNLSPAASAVRAANQQTRVSQEVAALRQIGAQNTTLAAQLDHVTITRAESNLYNQLADQARIRPNTSNDAFYRANTDRALLANNNFDMNHVLAGEINARGAATGYHAEFAADGAARIAPGANIVRNPNGTFEAPVQIWDEVSRAWIDKRRSSTFFPPDWSQARIEYETSGAFSNRRSDPQGGWLGESPSGIEIRFFWDPKNQRTTFYPLGGP
ncbi:EndoU domain-containing protein, partial [Ramlibacter sp. AN1015]|uniref:EndoU domain-containing protein n=1 Tax=Ramlibacter sp. AN1015 TaxID=3133428 RepID=UPI0030C63373